MGRSLVVVALIGLGIGLGWWARRPAAPSSGDAPQVETRWGWRWRQADPPAPAAPTEACSVELELALALLEVPDDVPLAPPTTEIGCQDRLALALALIEAAQLAQAGRPEPFPDDLEARYQPAGFQADARRIAKDCPGATLLGFDCDESRTADR